METTHIYALIDPETNEVRYIGKANNISQRYRAHLNRVRKHQIHKKNWIESLRRKKLKPIIVVVDTVPIKDWIFWEKYWIAQMKTWGFNLINYTMGGDGCTFGNETSFKKGISPWNIGIPRPDETRQKIRDGNKDKIISKETKQKMSVSHKGKPPAYMKDGIPESAMEKMRPTQFKKGEAIRKGCKCTAESKFKMKISHKKAAKIVLQYDLTDNFVAEYESIEEAAKSVSGHPENISAVCHGRMKTHRKYKWSFKN